MIGKISIGKTFSGCINYCLQDKNNQLNSRGEILHYNNCYGESNELIAQFNDVTDLNNRIEKPVWHTSLNFAPGDKLNKSELIDIANEYANKAGLSNNQYIVIQHTDTKHQHIHIIANRVGFDGKAISDSNNYKKVSEFCRSMEKKYQLTEVLSPRKFLDKSQRYIPRHDLRKDQLKNTINEVLPKCKNLPEFTNKMQQKGYNLDIGRGIAFIDKNFVRFKGSQVGFTLNLIKDTLVKNITQSISNQRSQNIKLGL